MLQYRILGSVISSISDIISITNSIIGVTRRQRIPLTQDYNSNYYTCLHTINNSSRMDGTSRMSIILASSGVTSNMTENSHNNIWSS